jgi:predicted NBD/HSP70 family sugar kinase
MSLTDELIADGVVELQEASHPRSPLAFTSDRCFVAAGAVMADRIEFALVGLDGQVRNYTRQKVRPHASAATLQDALQQGLDTLREACPGQLFGMGVSLAGIVDPTRGLWHSAIHFPHIARHAIASTLDEALGCPVMVENDARASLWGALWYNPNLTALENVVYLSLGSGIGSALLIKGQLHTGSHFWAGELGHMQAGDEGRVCCCGKQDCLETYCAIPALAAELHRITPSLDENATPRELADLIRVNPQAAAVADQAMARLGRLLGTLASYVDPDAILLGEQEPALYEALLPSLRHHIEEKFQGRNAETIPIDLIASQTHAPLTGIAAMVFNEAFRNTLSPLYHGRPVFTR